MAIIEAQYTSFWPDALFSRPYRFERAGRLLMLRGSRSSTPQAIDLLQSLPPTLFWSQLHGLE